MERNPSGLVTGKVTVVTGGATGIGEAICKRFAQDGAKVVVNGLPGDPVTEVVNEITQTGGTAIGCTADVGTVDGANGCIRTALDGFGRLDVLIANAGLFPEMLELQDFPLERFEELVHSNIYGVYLPVRAALSELRRTKGVILALGSEAGIMGQPRAVAYGSTKGWVHAFVRGLAAEQGKYGVRANAVVPGPIDTEMTRPSRGNMKVVNAIMAVESVPMGRRGTPEEVANVCMYLASDLASFVNGCLHTVDGGTTASSGLPGLEAKSQAKKAPEESVKLQHQHEGRGTLS